MQFGDSAARYSHADWAREQQAEPACHAAMSYIVLGPTPSLLADFFSCFPSHQRPSFSEIQGLAGKGRLHTTDDGIVLLVRLPNPQPPSVSQRPVGRVACSLNDEPAHVYATLLMRPWIMQACHSIVFCHLGTTRMLERFSWWIGMNFCTRWWLRHYLTCQTRKISRLTVRWPIISMPLPEGPGVAVSVDYFGPLPVTPRGNTYTLLFTDRFSRRADMPVFTAAEFTAEGTANILINRYIPLWGFPRSILSDNGLHFCSMLSHAACKLLGVRKIATSSYHPKGNSEVERENHTKAEMLAMVVNELQNNWDEQLPRVESAYNNLVSAASGLAANEVHMGRLPRLPLAIIERTGVAGHQSLARDHLATATWRRTATSSRTISSVNTMPS